MLFPGVPRCRSLAFDVWIGPATEGGRVGAGPTNSFKRELGRFPSSQLWRGWRSSRYRRVGARRRGCRVFGARFRPIARRPEGSRAASLWLGRNLTMTWIGPPSKGEGAGSSSGSRSALRKAPRPQQSTRSQNVALNRVVCAPVRIGRTWSNPGRVKIANRGHATRVHTVVVAESHVPIDIGSRQGLARAPRRQGLGGTCGQPQSGQTQTARQHQSRCEPRDSSLHRSHVDSFRQQFAVLGGTSG